MKKLLFVVLTALLGTYVFAAQAASRLVFKLENGAHIEVEWLGTEADESEIEVAWEMGGPTALYQGDVCFKGKVDEAIRILESLDDSNFMGDEFSIRNIKADSANRISLEIFDGPNNEVSSEVIVESCP